jgi:hypothetical protein
MAYLKADGFDGAIIGVDANVERIVYDKYKMIEILISQGWDHDDALEHLEYNVWCAYVGRFMWKIPRITFVMWMSWVLPSLNRNEMIYDF